MQGEGGAKGTQDIDEYSKGVWKISLTTQGFLRPSMKKVSAQKPQLKQRLKWNPR